jgi:tetratricopeptide (TPR) repeat protein
MQSPMTMFPLGTMADYPSDAVKLKKTGSATFMHTVKVLVIAVAASAALVSCNRDPNVAKKRYLESGNKYFNRGKYKEASIMYRNALQKDLRYGPAQYKLGLTSIKLGQLAPAVQYLRRAIELLPTDQPDHWDAVIKLSEIYLAAAPGKQFLDEVDGYIKQLLKRDPNSFDGHRLGGDLAYVQASAGFRAGQKDKAKASLEQALAEYRKADAIKPDQIGIEMQLARTLSAEGDFAGAEQIYRKLIEKDKNAEYAYRELYRLYAVTGKAGEGEEVLRLAAQNEPKQFGFLTLLATHYFRTGHRDEAVKVLDQIKSHSKEFPAAFIAVGDFYLRMGDGNSAVAQYREGIAKDPKRKSTYQKRIIEVLMRQGKRDEAAQINADILKTDPGDNDARGLAATLLLDKGDVNRALAELQAVTSRAPKNPVAHFNLGRAHEARGELEQARQEFQRAVELRPDYLLARLATAELLLRRREWDGALRSARQVLAVDRTSLNAHLVASAALMGEKRFTDARTELDQLVKVYPNSSDVHYQLGLVNLADKNYKEAENSFRKSYELNPGTTRPLMGIVETYVSQNKIDQAMNTLEVESAKAPKRVELRVAFATAAVMSHRFDTAVSQYQAALGLLGSDNVAKSDIYLRLGETYRLKGDYANSVASLEQGRKLAPDNPVILSTLALAFESAGRKADARQTYEAALKIQPNNGIALNNLAFLIADNGGDLDQALTLAQRAKQMMPGVAEVSDTLGMIYLRKNLSDNAIDIFKELVTRDPRATFRYHLGMAFSQKGDKPRARQELQQALKENPSQEEKEKIEQLMNRLG